MSTDSVTEATERAIAAAAHLTPMDDGAVATLRVLAARIDALGDARSLDNVSAPTYLKCCEALGLTPAGRLRLREHRTPTLGKLAELRAEVPPAGTAPRERR